MLHVISLVVKSVNAATLRESTHHFMLTYTKLSTICQAGDNIQYFKTLTTLGHGPTACVASTPALSYGLGLLLMLLWPASGDVKTPADPPPSRACVGVAATPAGMSPPPGDATDLAGVADC